MKNDSKKPLWNVMSRKTILETKFLKVHQDKVELPNDKIIDDIKSGKWQSSTAISALSVTGILFH